MNQIHVVVSRTYNEVKNGELSDFLKDNSDEIAECDLRRPPPYRVTLDSGLRTYFISYQHYWEWCKGRTYFMEGKKFHSGYPC